jgi:hypothetical protein
MRGRGTLLGVRAWWVYWASIVVGVLVWIGAVAIGGRDGLRGMLHQPVGLVVLVLPVVVAGANLILFRHTHEEVCRVEVERHGWLRTMTGGGYSARTFVWTGVALLALAVAILAAVLAGGI